jgi:hypothetical protein
VRNWPWIRQVQGRLCSQRAALESMTSPRDSALCRCDLRALGIRGLVAGGASRWSWPVEATERAGEVRGQAIVFIERRADFAPRRPRSTGCRVLGNNGLRSLYNTVGRGGKARFTAGDDEAITPGDWALDRRRLRADVCCHPPSQRDRSLGATPLHPELRRSEACPRWGSRQWRFQLHARASTRRKYCPELRWGTPTREDLHVGRKVTSRKVLEPSTF